MKTLKLTSVVCLLLVMSGCTSQREQEQTRVNKSYNKLTISNLKVGSEPIVIENITDFDSYPNGSIYYKKDNKEYIYRGDYLFEVGPSKPVEK